MQLQGDHTFSASQRHVWERLNDAGVLARITPGLHELQIQEEDTYRAVFAIKMGPINSTFSGTLRVVDRVAPEQFRLLIDIAGKVGTVAAEATVTTARLVDGAQERTTVTFSAAAKLTGVLVRMGQRVLSGVGRMLTKQFFQALEQELQVATSLQTTPLQEEDP